MANIITDLGGGEMAVRMTNGRFAREPIPATFTGWSALRVALYLQINDSGGNITGTPRFAFGLCAGSTNIMGDATTDHFAGMITNVATWTRVAGPPTYYATTSMTSPAKKVGATLTVGTTFSGGAFHTSAPSMFFIDITKGSPNYSFRLFEYNAAAAPVVTLANFLATSVAGVPVFTNHTYAVAQTVAVDEAVDGTFDHGCVWWDRTSPTMDILAWRMYRLA